MDVGISLLVYNFMRTALAGRPAAEPAGRLAAPGPSAAGA
jgi:hypothetical protein